MNATQTQTKTKPQTVKASVPLSPVVAPVGKSVKGAHIQAWRACDKFAHDASIELNPDAAGLWKAGTPGDRFYKDVLVKAKTVGDAVALGGKLTPVIKEAEIQGHLRWIYTASGAYIRIGGKAFPQDPHVKAAKPAKVK